MIQKIRKGDTSKISGNYQYKAVTEGNIIQKYWHKEKQKIINQFCKLKPTDIVLDCGCGSGVIANILSSKCKTVVAVDGNKGAIQFARSTYKRQNIRFIHSLVEDINFPEGYFTKIFCLEVLEHLYIEQGLNLLKKFFMLLSKGGRVFITTPNYSGLWPIVEWLTDKTRKAAHMADEQHVSKYNRKLLIKQIEEAGLKVEICGTFSTFAPFVSIISEEFSDLLSSFEIKVNMPFGNIIYLEAQRIN